MIRFVEETGSTNADLVVALRSEAKPLEGDWLVTRRQTAGRGRQGRQWFDGSGNFMGSTIVEVHENDPPSASLSFVAALALGFVIDRLLGDGAQVRLKWPNDVQIEGGKVSGILLEMVGRTVVVGIGVNLAQAPDLVDRKTTALSDFGVRVTPEIFAESLAETFANYVKAWRMSGLGGILRDFLDHSMHTAGSIISVHDTDGSRIEGSFAGLEETDGALRLRLADGSERVIRAGDIS